MILAVTFAEKLQMNMKSGEEMRYDLVDQRPQLGDNFVVAFSVLFEMEKVATARHPFASLFSL